MTPERMLELFGARLDDFALQQQDGRYIRQRRPLTSLELDRHLAGTITIGAYQLDAEGMGRWLCIDLDAPEREWLEMLWRAAVDLRVPEAAMLREFSGSKGYHLWVFMHERTEGSKLRKLGELIRDKSGVPATDSRYLHPDGRPRQLVEVYPKTTDLTTTDKSMGQLVKLPLGVHRKTGRLAEPIDVQGRIEALTPDEVDALLAPFENVSFLPVQGAERAKAATGGKHQPYPCTPGLMAATWGEGGRNSAMFLIAKRLNVAGFSEEEVFEQLWEWNLAHCSPALTKREVRTTARSGMRYTSMDCLNPDVVPHCKASCPIYAREHPATPSGNGLGPKLKVTNTDPPLYLLPLASGVVRVTHEELLEWETVRRAATGQLHVFLPRRRPNEWDRELEPLLRDVEVVETPPEVSAEGVVKGLLHTWCQRASDDPAQVERRNVWLDEEQGLYVFKGDSFIRYVQNIERGMDRMLIWRVVRAAGGDRRERELPGDEKPTEVWEVPHRAD